MLLLAARAYESEEKGDNHNTKTRRGIIHTTNTIGIKSRLQESR